jgi:hypothetical protein
MGKIVHVIADDCDDDDCIVVEPKSAKPPVAALKKHHGPSLWSDVSHIVARLF